MMPRSALETPLVAFSLFSAAVHFTGETAYHVKWGQPLPMLLVDYIAIGLLVFASARSLAVRPDRSAMGLLAGGWGFTFCLNWRSYFGRAVEQAAGRGPGNGEPAWVAPLLGALLLVSGAVFLLCFALADPSRGRGR